MKGGKMKTVGTRAQVMNGTAMKTSGGLKKSDLKYNNSGKIVTKEVINDNGVITEKYY